MREDLTGYWQAKERGDLKARAFLIDRFRVLVPATRQRQFRGVPGRLVEDLEAEGYLMLVRAVDEFDRSRGTAFPSWAITKIRGGMLEFLRRDDWVTRGERDRERRGEGDRTYTLVSLETLMYRDEADEGGLSELDRLADPRSPVEEQVVDRLEREMLRGFVRWLPSQQQETLCRYYWREESLKQIARTANLSESRVHQIHAESLRRLQGWLRKTGALHG